MVSIQRMFKKMVAAMKQRSVDESMACNRGSVSGSFDVSVNKLGRLWQATALIF